MTDQKTRHSEITMSNAEVITRYFKTFFSGKARHSEVRSWLADDFSFRDPLMSADSADDYVAQLTNLGDEMDVRIKLRSMVAENDAVVARVDVDGPAGPVRYAQWFTLSDGKIAALEVFYDPRPFLQGGGR